MASVQFWNRIPLAIALVTAGVAFVASAACGSDDESPASTTSPEDEAGSTADAGPRMFVDKTDLLPEIRRSVTDLAVVDLDGDGDRDIFWVSQDFPVTGEPSFSGGFDITKNAGGGRFEVGDVSSISGIGGWLRVLAVDVDGDGDVDVVLTRAARTSAQATLLLNDGKGIFSERPLPAITGVDDGVVFGRATAGDFDGDGDPDLVVPTSFLVDATGVPLADSRADVLLINQGGGNFVRDTSGAVPRLPNDYTFSSALAHFTGDSRADLFVSRAEQPPAFLHNDAGVFEDKSEAGVPTEPNRGYRTEAVDVDGDGDLDVVVVNDASPDADGGVKTLPTRLYINDGTGRFTMTPLPTSADRDGRALAFGDFDMDGRLDIVVGNGTLTLPHGGTSLEVLLGRGGTSFERMLGVPQPAAGVFALGVGDLDGDGHADIVVGIGEPAAPGGELRSRLLLSQPVASP